MKYMHAPAGFMARLAKATGILGQAAMAFMVVSLFYDVMMRYLFAAPTHWALEVNTFLLLTERMPRRIVERLQTLRGVAGILFCAAMTWKGSVMAWQAWQHNDRMSTSLGTPMFIPYLFLPLGFILLGLQYAILIKSGLTLKKEEARTGPQI
jgi:TRAP-type C4-dicarboxylate transport system permease small subunit